MKANKHNLLTSAVILLPCLLGLLLWKRLPQELPTHFSLAGQTNGWSARGFAVFGIPLLCLVSHWLCLWGMKRDGNTRQNPRLTGVIVWTFPVISLTVSAMVFGAGLGLEWDVGRILVLALGLLFLAMGNYLPKCRQNATLGIKLPWTLYSEENWNRTHRFGGKCWFMGGLVVMALAFAPTGGLAIVLPVALLLVIVAPTIYSWRLSVAQKRSGTWAQSALSREIQPFRAKTTALILLLIVLLVALVAVILFSGHITFSLENDALTVQASFWEDITVPYAEITAVEYRDAAVDGERVWGFGSLKLEMGQFRNEEFGDYTRYTYLGCESAVVVRLGQAVLVLSAADETQTAQLAQQLEQQLARSR